MNEPYIHMHVLNNVQEEKYFSHWTIDEEGKAQHDDVRVKLQHPVLIKCLN